MLDSAIEALKTYQSGVDPKVLQPIEKKILACHGDAAASQSLELRLVEVLRGDVPHAAKDAICRMLRTFGSAASVPALAALLADERLSHMARYALERIPAPEAGRALLDALPKTSGKEKIGIITSLGVRADAESIAALQALISSKDAAVARSAALALGEIGTGEAAKALLAASPVPEVLSCHADALLACAGKLTVAGETASATGIYQKIAGGGYSEPAVSAAKRGLHSSSM
jgi:HEAT repeat protein